MANAIYGLGREKFLSGSIDMATDDIKCVLVDTATYSVSIDADEFLDDIGAGERVATSGNMSSKTVALGVFDAADITFSAVSGDVSEALVIYKDSGVAATSPLIAYIDTATGLPVTPNGGDITVTWDSGANKIFKL
tara:strand:- start:1462 stop:1869 length:408 start_codon:yes stop_codon:yes gene_type:complete